MAFAVAELEIRAAVFDELDGLPLVGVEADTAALLADQLRFEHRDDLGLLADEYAVEGGGFDLERRLADQLEDGEMPEHDTRALVAEGDETAGQAAVLAWAAVGCVLLFLVARAWWSRTRSAPRARDTDEPDVGLVPDPARAERPSRPMTYAALAAWALVSVLPAAQLSLDSRADRAGADAARQSVQLSTRLVGSQLVTPTRIGAQLAAIRGSQRGLARQLVASESGDADQASLGDAEALAAERWPAVLATMTEPASADDGLAPEAVSALTSGPADWNWLVRTQND